MIIPWRLIIAAGALAAIVGGAWWWIEHEREAGRLEEREVWKRKEAIEADEAAVRRAVIARNHQEIVSHAAEQISQATLERDAAVAASGRLQKRIAAYVQAGRAASAAQGGDSASDPIGVLAELLGRADQRAGELADYADRARIAGETCQRLYGALTPREGQDGGRMDH